MITKKNTYFAFSLFFAVLIITAGCAKKQQQKAPQARPVQTAIAAQKDVPIYIDSFGNLTTPNNVDIKSQVTGKVIEVFFKEGDKVKKDDVLFTIDPSEFQADVDRETAAVKQDMADLKLKRDTLERNKKLIATNVISKEDFEKFETDVESAEAKLELDKANLELAKINLGYCKVCSPIDGITSKRQVDPGNIATANTGPTLVNIKTIDPLYIDFTIIERDLNRARSSMKDSKLSVEITSDGQKHTGELQFLDNAVDELTGTISLRAIVRNSDGSLWPGQFVTVKLILGTEKNAVLVPYNAVQMGQKGYYVFAVTPDNKADLRIVTPGSRQDDDIVIEQGVKTGEKVVTSGQMGLAPGVLVAETS